MYKIYADSTLLCDSSIEELAIIDPVISLEVNKAGTFEFVIPPGHPYYSLIEKRKTILSVYRDEETEPIFEGMAVSVSDDFYLQRTIECEGELSFFNDTIQRPARYQGVSVRTLLETYINIHNSLCEDSKHFTVGQVTVEDPNDYIYCYTNYDTTMSSIQEDLVDDLGGYLRVRHVDGVRYLDYLAESPHTATQVIRLGDNLIDFDSSLDTTELITAIIPLGAVLEEESRTSEAIEGLDERLTIKSVNDGKDYLASKSAVENYGWIEQTVEWDDVETATELKEKGQKYLSDTQFENMTIDAKAIDLHFDDSDVESFYLLDKIRVVSAPHGLDRYFLLSQITYNLNNPENDQVTLGEDVSYSISASTKSANEDILKRMDKLPTSTVVDSAIDNATQLISGNKGGYVKIKNDSTTKKPSEILIMDTDSEDTALKIWRWNQNGLGYASREQATDPLSYGLAMTSDGSIVADYITSGTMYADRIKGGTLTLGGSDNVNGSMSIKDADGNVIGSWSKDGISAQKGNIAGLTVTEDALTYSEGDTDYFKLTPSSTGIILKAGYVSGESYNCFQVDYDGSVYAPTISTGTLNVTILERANSIETTYLTVGGNYYQYMSKYAFSSSPSIKSVTCVKSSSNFYGFTGSVTWISKKMVDGSYCYVASSIPTMTSLSSSSTTDTIYGFSSSPTISSFGYLGHS